MTVSRASSTRAREPSARLRLPGAPAQLKAKGAASNAVAAVPGLTGLPEGLKAGVEALSGLAMGDVRVHRNSAEPARLGALAYTQGSDIHLGPGQERHLPHEAWHVVQQKQGRVQATGAVHGKPLNDEHPLEQEADRMGASALAAGAMARGSRPEAAPAAPRSAPIQRRVFVGEGPQRRQVTFVDLQLSAALTDEQIERLEAMMESRLDESFATDEELIAYLREPPEEEKDADAHEQDALEEFDMDYRLRLDRGSKKSAKRKARRNQPGKPLPDRAATAREALSGMSGKESTTGLSAVDSLQEAVFSNLVQGGLNVQKPNRKGQSYLRNMKNTLESKEAKDRNYLTQLERTRAAILEGKNLVRKLSEAEARSFRTAGGDRTRIFPSGTEGMKAFRIDARYTFQDAARNQQEGAYDVVMSIRLTPRLKTYFINFLSPNVSNPLGVTDRELRFGANPQFKYEGEGVSILIPPSGWESFWSFVENDTTFRTGA